MKYVCLGYYDEKKWEMMSESEQKALMEKCFDYDDVLRKNGHIAGAKRCKLPAMPPPYDSKVAR